ncbi:homeobox-domain-containing protein [Hesseltinella vesiculosa]|uniref:Homeobox-domain-containing protein n=1 Tax=Hesseltinella vesiculosa TaxID=101127 RepID=A0A1X2GIL0_9FUNG|nr:homeobox-domain-containing protein [Hesseltinella vesiculosa]
MTKAPATRPRKRTHLSGEQIASLQASFDSNPLPDATIRHRLAVYLGITERTVQIWFQNRRAKARKMEAGNTSAPAGTTPGGWAGAASGLTNPSPYRHPLLPSARQPAPRYQPTFCKMMTPDRFEKMQSAPPPPAIASAPTHGIRQRPRSASKPEPKSKSLVDTLPARAMSEDTARPLALANDGLAGAINVPAHVLRIGTWTRFASSAVDNWGLTCLCNQQELIWQIYANGQDFRIHVPFASVHQLSFGPVPEDPASAALQVQVDPSQLIFAMSLQGDEWVRCGDFSEDKQATHLYIHELQAPYELLQQAVLDIMTHVPELTSKWILSQSPSSACSTTSLDLCRDLTLSPSATPEPYMMQAMYQPLPVDRKSFDPSTSIMTLQAPFYYPVTNDPALLDSANTSPSYFQNLMFSDVINNLA